VLLRKKAEMTYSEKSQQLALDSSIAVQILMGAPDDVEFVPLKPRPADDRMLAELKTRWPGRGLRSVGVVGLVGVTPHYALKEPLEPEQVDMLAAAFLTYVRALLTSQEPRTDSVEKGDEVAWLCRLWSLPDTRPN
jgi:hypothetical protein